MTPRSNTRRDILLDYSYKCSPSKIRKKFKSTTEKQHMTKLMTKNAIQKSKRNITQVKKVKVLLRNLKMKCSLQEKVSSFIENNFSSSMNEIVNKLVQKKKNYTPELRAFALTLNFYSPKAYNFIRSEFGQSLPHPTTLRSWYHEIKVKERLTDESFKSLSIKSQEYRANGKTLFCSLMLDEMHIKKQIEWDG